MTATIVAIAPIFLFIITGRLLKQYYFQGANFWKEAEKLTYYVLFPALLILKLSKADFTTMNVAPAITVVILATFVIASLTFFFKYLFKIENSLFTSIFQGSTRYNSYVFLGMASSLFGEQGVALCGVFIAYMIIVTNILSVIVLNHYSLESKKNFFDVIRKIFTNPLILGSLTGVAIQLLGLQIPNILQVYMNSLGKAASPLSLLAVGAGLKLVFDYQKINAIVITLLLKLIALPVITVILFKIFNVNGVSSQVALLYACLPCAGNSYILARQMGGDAQSMASIITMTTLGTGLSAPLIFQLLV